jgi:hypothetical protein
MGEADMALTRDQTGPPYFGKRAKGSMADQRTRLIDRSEALEVCFYTLAHVLIEGPLLGT